MADITINGSLTMETRLQLRKQGEMTMETRLQMSTRKRLGYATSGIRIVGSLGYTTAKAMTKRGHISYVTSEIQSG